jgi:hypothetical protein
MMDGLDGWMMDRHAAKVGLLHGIVHTTYGIHCLLRYPHASTGLAATASSDGVLSFFEHSCMNDLHEFSNSKILHTEVKDLS